MILKFIGRNYIPTVLIRDQIKQMPVITGYHYSLVRPLNLLIRSLNSPTRSENGPMRAFK